MIREMEPGGRLDQQAKIRLLIVDDNRAIHSDFRKVLAPEGAAATRVEAAEAALFGGGLDAGPSSRLCFEIDSAYQGQEALAMVSQSVANGHHYSVAFVDVRMPPGWDGIETTARLWEVDPDLQIVICTAYSDYSWDDMLSKLGHSDRVVVLKKPFDGIEVLQARLEPEHQTAAPGRVQEPGGHAPGNGRDAHGPNWSANTRNSATSLTTPRPASSRPRKRAVTSAPTRPWPASLAMLPPRNSRRF